MIHDTNNPALPVSRVILHRELRQISKENNYPRRPLPTYKRIFDIVRRGKYARADLPALLREIEQFLNPGRNPQYMVTDFVPTKTISKLFDPVRSRGLIYDSDALQFNHNDIEYSDVSLKFWTNFTTVSKDRLEIYLAFSHVIVSSHMLQRVYERQIARQDLVHAVAPHVYDWMKLWVVMLSVRHRVFGDTNFALPMGDHLVFARKTATTTDLVKNRYTSMTKSEPGRTEYDHPRFFFNRSGKPMNLHITTVVEANELFDHQEWCNRSLRYFLGKHKATLDEALVQFYTKSDPSEFAKSSAFCEAQADMIRIMNHRSWLRTNKQTKHSYFTRAHPERIYGHPVETLYPVLDLDHG